MSSCQDIIDRLGAAYERALEWLGIAEDEAAAPLEWVAGPPGTVVLDGVETDNLASLVQQVTNLGGGFDRWVYVEQASPGTDTVSLPVAVSAALVRCYLNGVPLADPADYAVVDEVSVVLVYPLERRDRLEIRTYGG